MTADLDLLAHSISLWGFDPAESGHLATLGSYMVTLKQGPSYPLSCLLCNSYKWPAVLQKEMFYTYTGTSSGSLPGIPDHKKTVGETFIYFSVAMKITEHKEISLKDFFSLNYA